MTRSALVLTLLSLGIATSASAQGLSQAGEPLRALTNRGVPSQQEYAYADNLALTLGPAQAPPRSIQVPYAEHDLKEASSYERIRARSTNAGPTFSAPGVQVEVGGVQIQRLRFVYPRHAEAFAAYAADLSGGPALIDVRGRQVVIARGERLANPAELQRIQRAAWSVLPHARGEPTLVGLTLSPEAAYIRSRVRIRHLSHHVSDVRQEARRGFAHYEGDMPAPGEVRYWYDRTKAPGTSPLIKVLSDTLTEESRRLSRRPSRKPSAPAATQAPAAEAPSANRASQSGIGGAIRGLGNYNDD